MGSQKLEKLLADSITTQHLDMQEPAKKIKRLILSNLLIDNMIEQLIQDESESICYTADNGKSIKVKIIQFENGQYFAKLGCKSLADVEDKQLFIRKAVEFALREKKLSTPFQNMGIGGIIGDHGRLGFFYKMFGKKPPSIHAYVAFKTPGEDDLHIEDPRTEFFKIGHKLQSLVNDQVCSFAATALFYFAYKALADYKDTSFSTEKMFEEIHQCPELKKIIKELEEKVGVSTETKEEIIAAFVQKILDFTNPVQSTIIYSPSFHS